MSTRSRTLFDGARTTMQDSIRMTAESLNAYGPLHDHWAIAWSGGKDSTTTLTLVLYLIESGQVAAPKSLTVFYADTRLELTPLAISATQMMGQLRDRGIAVQVVMAPMDQRFMVYMLGRGVPPAGAGFRWCTGLVKINPMKVAVRELAANLGERFLMLIGLRLGESAARDERIAIACTTNGGECGQGLYQSALPDTEAAILSPVLHWRVCHVWDWLRVFAPTRKYGEWDTQLLADAYGGDEAEEINARTGCIGCPVASRDMALDAVLPMPAWSYLAPMKGLRPLWEELRLAKHRIRKPGGETGKDGKPVHNQNRMGPLQLASRLWALDHVLDIQSRVNTEARRIGRPEIDILNAEEELRIRELIDSNTWPDKWTGAEPAATDMYVETFRDGTAQPLLFGG